MSFIKYKSRLISRMFPYSSKLYARFQRSSGGPNLAQIETNSNYTCGGEDLIMYVNCWITVLYTGNQHDIIYPVYINYKNFFLKKPTPTTVIQRNSNLWVWSTLDSNSEVHEGDSLVELHVGGNGHVSEEGMPFLLPRHVSVVYDKPFLFISQ